MDTAIAFTLSPATSLLSPAPAAVVALADCIRHGSSIRADFASERVIQPESRNSQFLLCKTSGSAGGAKTIRRRPASWIRSFEVNAGQFGLGPHDVFATFGHLGHSLSLYAALEAFHLGADLAVMTGQMPKSQASRLAEQKVSVLYATPSQLQLLIAGAAAAGLAQIPELRLIMSGGGKLYPRLREDLRRLLPHAEIVEFFGASETSFIAISDATTPEGSVGRAYPGVNIRIGLDLPPGQTGEIWVTSPYLFDGYEGAASPDTKFDGACLSIGEMGYLDENGYLFLRGRKSRMVTVADKNVFPEEIERVVLKTPGIEICAATALPDVKRGHRIVCVVEGAKHKHLEKMLRQSCRDALGPHAVPQTFVFQDDLPLLPAGKPDLQALLGQLDGRA